jgi:hypothetical protein
MFNGEAGGLRKSSATLWFRLTLVPYLITISICDFLPGPRYTSGDLVEPMSVWSASECFMLILVLSPSRRLIQVLVGDIHCRIFSDLYPGKNVKPTPHTQEGSICRFTYVVTTGLRFGSKYTTLSQRQRIFHVHAQKPWIIYAKRVLKSPSVHKW